jgi:hypothetical protein
MIAGHPAYAHYSAFLGEYQIIAGYLPLLRRAIGIELPTPLLLEL